MFWDNEKIYKVPKNFSLCPKNFFLCPKSICKCPKKNLHLKMTKSSLSQIFFAMSQNLYINFIKFLKKLECLGQIFKLWDTANQFWDNSCFGTKISIPLILYQ